MENMLLLPDRVRHLNAAVIQQVGVFRLTPLGQIASRFLETYLNGIRPQLLGECHNDRLSLSYRGNPIDGHSVGDLVKRHAGLARVKKRVTPHVWRHYAASGIGATAQPCLTVLSILTTKPASVTGSS